MNLRPHSFRAAAGFSLVELLTVLALGAVLCCCASLRNGKKGRLHETADLIAAMLERSQLKAMALASETRLQFAGDGSIWQEEPSCAAKRKIYALPPPLRFADVSFGTTARNRNTAFFGADGSTAAGRVVLTDRGRRCAIIQSRLGARRIACGTSPGE